MIGLIIGAAAVETMVALGNGARAAVEDEVGSAGTNLVFVTAGNYTRGGDAVNIPSGRGSATTLTLDDAEAIRAVTNVKFAAAEVNDLAPFVAGNRKTFGPVIGTETSFADIFSWTWAHGAMFTGNDVSQGAAVAVLGKGVSEVLFGVDVNPVGRELLIRQTAYRVVGVADGRDASQSEMVYVPLTSLQRALGLLHLHKITILAERAGDASHIGQDIAALLRTRHRLDPPGQGAAERSGLGGFQGPMAASGRVPDDFTIRTQASAALTKGLYTSAAAFVLASMPSLDQVTSEEMAGTLARANQTMTILLASLATVSLVVGGFGIMNIMLLAVTERTREIGVRLAVGARTRDVLIQFLVEAATLSMLGGLVGIVVGFACAELVTRLLDWPTLISPSAMAMAFALAASVGVAFGYYPARRASRLDPIEALRFE